MAGRPLSSHVLAVAMALTACGSSETVSSTTVEAPTTTTMAVSTSTSTVETTSTTVEATTTTTSDPALAMYAGLWQWPESDQKLMKLNDDGSFAVGYTLDGAPQLGLRGAVGEWEVVDGGIAITGLDIGDCPDDVVGTYELDESEDGFEMVLVDDECTDRVNWLLGFDSPSHAWVPSGP